MEELRFACDAMLGRLARWLRFAGVDTTFDAEVDDLELAARARWQGRWLLSRDRGLISRAGPRAVLLGGTSVAEQVRELEDRLDLRVDPARFLSRCAACNEPLRNAAPDDVRDRIPPYVAIHGERFSRCPGCGRIYWPGSHTPRILAHLSAMFRAP